jgi:hypothetical protein
MFLSLRPFRDDDRLNALGERPVPWLEVERQPYPRHIAQILESVGISLWPARNAVSVISISRGRASTWDAHVFGMQPREAARARGSSAF